MKINNRLFIVFLRSRRRQPFENWQHQHFALPLMKIAAAWFKIKSKSRRSFLRMRRIMEKRMASPPVLRPPFSHPRRTALMELGQGIFAECGMQGAFIEGKENIILYCIIIADDISGQSVWIYRYIPKMHPHASLPGAMRCHIPARYW